MMDSKLSLMINTDDLATILDRCKTAKITPSVGVRHYYWGTLEVVIKDPDGVVLVFIQAYDTEIATKLHADETWGKVPQS
ncbi:hypothetical protein A3B57_03375 [Microgenomates group bacterium RIFCSPLOWO2_01_FULL_47_10]|nr:MAG: hypothetical protein A3B57_03375 [Microgenomates group bacterium RIFCSPLOWO2_01_FULL_47_10]